MNAISYGRHHISDDDIQAVVDVLRSDYLTQGPVVQDFEAAFSEYVGSKYAIAVCNGTAALHLSVLALNLNPGDKVLTTPLTFVASANCVRYCGGDVDFVDIDPETYLMDLGKLEEKLSSSPAGTYKGVIPVDFAGYPTDVERLSEIAKKYDLWILQDCCHSPGGGFEDSKGIQQKCGNGSYSDIQVFSFHPVKHIATGEGGMVTTNSKHLYERICRLRSHGITKDPGHMIGNHGGWYYEMQELGYNYRLTDIQAALGVSQLKRAAQGLERRREIAACYDKAFEGVDQIKTPKIAKGFSHAYHLYVIQVDGRKELYDYLKTQNIFSQVLYVPVHLQPYYKQLGWKKGDFPLVEDYYKHCLALPMYPSLTLDDQSSVIDNVIRYVTGITISTVE
jgi:UDP-4-amino-4,6-dideoxy-N-acetyl-beta-L-altrosamine transaminase